MFGNRPTRPTSIKLHFQQDIKLYWQGIFFLFENGLMVMPANFKTQFPSQLRILTFLPQLNNTTARVRDNIYIFQMQPLKNGIDSENA